jgi:enterochelin esterase-like enzyme
VFRLSHFLSLTSMVTLLLSVLLVACQPQSPQVVIITIPAPTLPPTATPLPPTLTPAPTLTPTLTPVPALGCNELQGRVENIQVEDKRYSTKTMEVNVYLPPCYDSHPLSGGYPVLYYLHGQSFSNDQWLRLGASKTADSYFTSGRFKPFMIVMPREEYYLQDYSQSVFGEMLVNSVIPWIDSHYHTCSQRACRAIGGLSRGAVWAVFLGLNHWQLFGAFGAHSLTDVPLLEASVRDHFKEMLTDSAGLSRVYLDSGKTDGLHTRAELFESYLKKYGVSHEWHVFPGGHDETYWSSHIGDYLAWYAANWQKR